MRDIIFRGKRVDNGEWVEGYYCNIGYTGDEKHYIIPKYASAFYGVEVIPETVSQYTGLEDKDGKKIFEGDICKIETWELEFLFGLITWDKKYAKFEVQEYEPYINNCVEIESFDDWTEITHFEIVGNIHDNPELLGGN